MTAIPKGSTHRRKCVQCGSRFPARLPGSGVRIDCCDEECEDAFNRSKAQKSTERSNLRKVANRQGRRSDPLADVHGVYEFPIKHGYDPHHWVKQGELRKYVRDLDLPDAEAIALLRDLLSDERNISVLEHTVHWDGHYNPRRLFTRADIKPEAWDFAADLGLTHLLEKTYQEAASAASNEGQAA